MSWFKRSCFWISALYLIVGAGQSFAQGGSCRDPWINQAFNQIFRRAPQGSGTGGECNTNLYGGGSWSSYQDLFNKVLTSKDCQDPWIGEAYVVAFGRHASGNECSGSNYGGGRWSSFPDLVTKVQQYQNSRQSSQPAQPVSSPAAPAANTSGCADAWITQAFNQAFRRAPQGSGSSGECNTNLYGGGSWSSYQDLYNKVLSSKDCQDPWIGEAYVVGLGRHASGNECSGSNYGGGRWSNFPDLVSKVQQYQNSRQSSQPTQPVNSPSAPVANASGCKDVWITQAFNQAFRRAPQGSGASGECNINLYGGGSWSSYQDLYNKVLSSKDCQDPWIGEAYVIGLGRHATGNECSGANYGGGHWSSFTDLVSKVRQYQSQASTHTQNPTTSPAPSTGASAGPCRDAWVSQAVQQVRGRAAFGSGDIGECNPALYGANWSSYSDLLARVQQTSRALDQAGLQFGSNGRTFDDKKYFETILGTGWVGPVSQAPRDKNWHILLVSGYELAINRKCAPNESSAGASAGSGCVATAGSPTQTQRGGWSNPAPAPTRPSRPSQGWAPASAPVTLVSQLGSKCLDVEGGRIAVGAHLIGYPCNGNSNEQFVFQSNGTLTLNGLCVAGGNDGEQLVLAGCQGTPTERWNLTAGQLVSGTGRCADLKGGSGWWFGNQPAILYPCNGQVNQHWIKGVVVPSSRVKGITPTQSGTLATLSPVNASASVIAAGGANVIAAGGANVINAGGANVINAGGANVINAGGANVINAGGANVIAAGGANVIAAGGANMIILAQP